MTTIRHGGCGATILLLGLWTAPARADCRVSDPGRTDCDDATLEAVKAESIARMRGRDLCLADLTAERSTNEALRRHLATLQPLAAPRTDYALVIGVAGAALAVGIVVGLLVR